MHQSDLIFDDLEVDIESNRKTFSVLFVLIGTTCGPNKD